MARRGFGSALMGLGLVLGACGDDGDPAAGGGGVATTSSVVASTSDAASTDVATSVASSSGDGGASSTSTGSGGVTCSALAGESGDFDRTIQVGDSDRRFLLHVPASYDPTAGVSLVVAFHGFTEGPEDIRDTSHFDQISDERGFIVAYPEGLNGSWNGGTCCGLSVIANVDDVAFATALIDTIEADYCIDPARVFATGFSNGGFFSHRLGCELSGRIAAIGVVAGQESLTECNPTRPVPVLQVHGDADPVVPYGGNPLLGFPSTESTISGWAERDGCTGEPVAGPTIGDTSCAIYDACRAGSAVELCTVSGGGHDWPGGGSAWVDDTPPPGFVATIAIADFFEAHPMP